MSEKALHRGKLPTSTYHVPAHSRGSRPPLSRTKTNGARRLPPSRVLVGQIALYRRFISKLTRSPFKDEWEECCWIWTGRKTKNGYGEFVLRYGDKQYFLLAHRFSYMLHHGRWPSRNFDVDHKCHNRACVNPAHLRQCRPAKNRNYKGPRRPRNWSWKNQHGQG